MSEPLEIVIVGGGTAGWMCAAALVAAAGNKVLNVRLIESDEIGAVGVGEATLPQIKDFNDQLGILEAEFMQKTQATFKLGIDFVDWGHLGSRYVHPFGVHGSPINGVPFYQYWIRGRRNGLTHEIGDYSFPIVACRENRFDFPARDPKSIRSTYAYAYHFDASLYARFLRDFAEPRGLTRIEGKIEEVLLRADSGDVEGVRLASGEVVTGDLFIDCSGFRSLLIGQTLGVEFDDWTKWLPCDRAFAVPCESVNELTPYTRSTAREAGWQWRIALQHRTGNGYVFSSRFISEDEAAAKLLANLDGKALGEPRLLKFKAGRRKQSWVRNCVGVGLASGFLEPLESTSIYLIQVAINNLLNLLPQRQVDPRLAEEFNRLVDMEYDRVRDFLILHYHANTRTDSALWTYCREMSVPESLTHKIEMFRRRGHIHKSKSGLFAPPSWVSVFAGQGIEPVGYDPIVDGMDFEKLAATLETERRRIEAGVAAMPTHRDFVQDYCPANPVMSSSMAGVHP